MNTQLSITSIDNNALILVGIVVVLVAVGGVAGVALHLVDEVLGIVLHGLDALAIEVVGTHQLGCIALFPHGIGLVQEGVTEFLAQAIEMRLVNLAVGLITICRHQAVEYWFGYRLQFMAL